MVVDDAKQAMRTEMRALRRRLPNQAGRSMALWDALLDVDAVRQARHIMVFESIPGEPDTETLIERLHAAGVATAVPEDVDLEPTWPDVIVVPGLAFTEDGHRLGQGGGWYDRFLPQRRSDCHTVGVCFVEQVVEHVPTDVHDVVLDAVLSA